VATNSPSSPTNQNNPCCNGLSANKSRNLKLFRVYENKCYPGRKAKKKERKKERMYFVWTNNYQFLVAPMFA
jgi:hypothetical protein